MFRYLRLILPMVALAAVAGCGPDYSPDTYSTAAVQQANKVDQGVIAGFREVQIRADGTVGAVVGGAAGGVLGAQEPDGGVVTALSTIGGTLVGGLIGTSVEHVAGDTKAFEYLVRKTNGDLLSVTQKDATPLLVGLKVLVIEGKQARIVADYSAPLAPLPPASSSTAKKDGSKSETGDKTDAANKAGAVPASAPATAPQPAPAAAPPAADPHAADSGSAPQSPAAPSPQAVESSAAPPPPSAPAPQQPAPAAASPPAQGGQSAGDPGGAAAPAQVR